jgi:hypothetical protein
MFRRKNYYNQNNNKNDPFYMKKQYCNILYNRLKTLYPNISTKLIQKCIGMIYENPLYMIKQLVDNELEFLNTVLEAIKLLKEDQYVYHTQFSFIDELQKIIQSKSMDNVDKRKYYLCQQLFEKIKQEFPKFGYFLNCKIVGMISELECSEIETYLIDKTMFNEICKEALLVLKNVNNEEEIEVKNQAKTKDDLKDISVLNLNTLYNLYFLN